MKIALLGNPNTGKSSVFNMLTGLRQHVGNFPGVTVDKKSGTLTIDNEQHELIDFPGTYSLYPRSRDEQVVYDILTDPGHADYPDVVMVVADASNLERNLFFFSQIYDLGLPCVLALNMSDLAHREGKQINVEALHSAFEGAVIVETTARVNMGRSRVLDGIKQAAKQRPAGRFIPEQQLCSLDDPHCQELEAAMRYRKISGIIGQIEQRTERQQPTISKLDQLLVHPVLGYVIFALVLLIVFQFIYSFAAVPMDFIDARFASLAAYAASTLPPGIFTDLISQGVIPGIGGVVIFIPQIALLFFFISILEESGYLARVVFIMDRLMRPLGLNGKSVVPLLSSVACAIPGVMSARTISDWKERMITIMVAPLMSCSARIPVYTLLIALVIPKYQVFGFMNLQGLVLFGLYALGLVSALITAWVMKLFIRSKDKGFLLLELPGYKAPLWRNVGLTVWEKVRVFVVDAGKVILAISIILWALASFGPSDDMEQAGKAAAEKAKQEQLSEEETNRLIASAQLEQSYIGHLGKFIEPVIRPLGYDWKVGISLITSFAAREVFVGSLATIYAVQDDGEENLRLIDRLRAEKNPDGTPVYSLAMGVSLMVYYVYAMQCMSTLAVVKRETKGWKWPLIQTAYMGIIAYLGAFIAYTLLS
jgi:ferrous iron transport protein B